MVELNFEVEAVEPSSFGPLPAGEYDGEIVGCDIKETRSGTNMLSLEIQTDKGKVWDNLNLWHTNPKAVEIAKERLSAIGTALGMTGAPGACARWHPRTQPKLQRSSRLRGDV